MADGMTRSERFIWNGTWRSDRCRR